jgi:release factor glutamine methyltransferase
LLNGLFQIYHSQFTHSPFTILDIGTGRRCIAIALKKKLPLAVVHALDISGPALKIARQNAVSNRTDINFFRADILRENEMKDLQEFNIIVSNPPYVKRSEAEEMRTNVFLYEPHAAVFVPDEDPLVFYSHIACFSRSHLN